MPYVDQDQSPEIPPNWGRLAGGLLEAAEEELQKHGLRGYDARDIALDVLAEVWRRFARSGPLPRLPHTFLERVVRWRAKRRATDFRQAQARRARAEKNAASQRPSESPDDESPDPELVESLEQALRNLSAPERLIVELHYARGLTFRQIAGMLGEDERPLAAKGHRAFEKLRTLLEPQIPPSAE